MYAEDVDFSWRLRASDYKIKYCPTVKIMHYSYESIGAVKPAQYVNSLIKICCCDIVLAAFPM